MPTANMQLKQRIKSRCIIVAINAFTVFMVIGRLLSGVHWLTDIIGGVLLSIGLVMLYDAIVKTVEK
jgi:undecaprenyl-diphosphatase